MKLRYGFNTVAGIVFATVSLQAQQIDEIYNQKIREYTTDPRFLPASVLNLPDDPNVPSPRKHFGQIIGAPGVLHRTPEIYGYFKKLADASPYVSMEPVLTSEEGRPINLVIIGNDDAQKRLDHYKKQLALLADPRQVNPADLEKILGDTKLVYYLNGGMHSPEMGSPMMLMELAYRLATSQSEDIKTIRDNIIVLINPVSEPDGWDKQVDWYYRYTKNRKEFADGHPSVPYWGKYTYHDNNRDGLQNTQAITKGLYKIYYDWHPVVSLDLHESVPLLYISTGTGPYNETIDPITIGEWQTMAHHDITSLAAQGLPGVFTWAFYDGWYPGYGLWISNNHNSTGRFYETFGNAGASTYLRDLAEQKYAGDPATSKEWYRPVPPTEKVYWSYRNNINYMQAGVLASLSYGATNSRLLIKNFYQKGVNAIRKGTDETPRAFVIPKDQRDPGMAAYLVNQLRAQAIEVHKAETGLNAGDYVVLLNQPYRNLAVSLLTKQNYPKEAKFPPYDDIAWTLGYLYGVDVKAQDSVKYAPADLKLLTADAQYAGSLTRSDASDGTNYVLNYKAQSTVLPALYWAKNQSKTAKAAVLDERVILDSKDTLSAGSVVFGGLNAEQARKLSTQFGLDLKAVKGLPAANGSSVRQHDVTLPRVAIYHSWYSTQDEGWARYTFDQRSIPYTSIDKDDLKAGDLRKRFDVVLIPRMGGTAADFIHEIDKKYSPMPFTKTAEFPNHGLPDSTPDMTGGPGFDGINNLKTFVEAGGVLVALDNSAMMVAEAGIARPLRANTTAAGAGLFHPGSVVMAKARKTDSPLLYGYPETFPIFKGNTPLLQTAKYNRDMLVLQYGTKPLKDEEEYKGLIMGMPDKKPAKDRNVGPSETKAPKKEDPYVLSGMVKNEQAIIGHGAIFNVPVGAGRVVAFTFDPLHRFLNHHDAPMVWNALINWNQLNTPTKAVADSGTDAKGKTGGN
ncbi:M14 family zinc carboxypeptidase [Spirosoma montaniterrae]|uniref:Peptidase n=1 Tax=Spirosoma montaniterrae TaxID=1178516 RepID=A0A1P9WSD2_9BACT|nr:M14 family zinc carboxypeptidase [Spirosoma montaniterrae]AQG78278.1 peptidase [Spirosoma montaniterrae]